jgi:ketosteroid isomerase-like protein
MAHPNIELITRNGEALVKGDWAAYRAGFVDDPVWRGFATEPGRTINSIDEFRRYIGALRERSGERLHTERQSILADDTTVVTIDRVSAQRGDRSFVTRRVTVFHITDGKVDEVLLTLEDFPAVTAFYEGLTW